MTNIVTKTMAVAMSVALRGCRVSGVGCRALPRSLAPSAPNRADHRQRDDDEVVEPLRILRNRHRADAAGRNREPSDAIRRDGEDEQRAE